MEFSWTTFIFEVINFLVLLWILQRFLYVPVTSAINRRKAAIEANIATARSIEAEAQQLKRQYENRVAEWEKEKAAAREAMLSTLNTEKSRLMAELDESLQQERLRHQVLEQRRIAEVTERLTKDASAKAARFASQLLGRLACAELEAKICQVLLEDIGKLGATERASIIQANGAAEVAVTVASAFPLDAAGQQAIAAALADWLGRPVSCATILDPSLISGFRVSVGSWMLRCNLMDELAFFASSADPTS